MRQTKYQKKDYKVGQPKKIEDIQNQYAHMSRLVLARLNKSRIAFTSWP